MQFKVFYIGFKMVVMVMVKKRKLEFLRLDIKKIKKKKEEKEE